MKFLVVMKLAPGADLAPHLDEEGAAVQRLLDEGGLDEVWGLADRSGAVVVVNGEDEGAARARLESLPLVRHGLLGIGELVAIFRREEAPPA
jgi:hypothetical protein